MIVVLVAEVLGVDLAQVRLCAADTDLTPVDLGARSSNCRGYTPGAEASFTSSDGPPTAEGHAEITT